MGIRRIDPEQISSQRMEYVYENEDYNIRKSDGVILIFRPLSQAEQDEHDEEMQKLVKVKSTFAVKGRRGKGDNEREMVTEVKNPEAVRTLNKKRVQRSLIDWKGFETEEGEEIPFSWQEFESFCESYPDLFDFADECVDKAYNDAVGKLDSHAKN